MALVITIVDTEYRNDDGRDHLYYTIHLVQKATGWENSVDLKYSEIKYLHKKIEL